VRKVINRHRVVTVMTVALALLGGLRVEPAGAQTDSDKQQIDDQIKAIQGQISDANAQEAQLLTSLETSLATQRDLDAKVEALDGQISAVRRDLNAAQSKLSSAESEQRGAENRLSGAQQALADAHTKLANYAIAAYTGQSEAIQIMSATLKSRSIDELVAKRNYMDVVGTTQAEVISLDERLRNQVKDLTEQLTVAQQQAQAQRDAVAAQQAKLQESRDQQDAVRSQVATEVAHTADLKAQVVARKEEFESEEAALQQQSDAITAQLQARAAAQAAEAAAAKAAAAAGNQPASGSSGATSPADDAPASAALPSSSGVFIAPLDSYTITSPFGYRVHPIYGTTLLHTGVDMAAPEGTPIHVAASGVVVSAGWIDGYGNATIVDHGGGLATLYGHQSAILVSEGQKVTQGQTIGRVGCTGSCTGPHLHFEVRVNGTPVNPLNYVSL
jgi:murein DD-endopeptidase MepM/ murein hydrolase activator NlpD